MRPDTAQETVEALTLRCCARDMPAGAPSPSQGLRAPSASQENTHSAAGCLTLPKPPSAGLAALPCEHPFPRPCRGAYPGRLLT